MPQELTVFGEDPHVEIIDQHDHALALVCVPHADVVKPRFVAKRYLPVLVDRSLRTLTPAPMRNLGPSGGALSLASKAARGVIRPRARCGLMSL